MKQNRKRLKNKTRSTCAMCKPHKRGHTNRWTFSVLREEPDFENEFERWREEEYDRRSGPGDWSSWMTGRP